jgi:CRISPR-associated protein Cas2
MRLWIVSYDVSDDKRRRLLAKTLARRMQRVQESVFEGWLNALEIRQLVEEVQSVLDLRQDRLRAYPLALRTPGRYSVHGTQTPTEYSGEYWIV